MTNRLMNLDGTKPIMENWDDLNEGFNNTEAELDAAAAVSESIQAEVTAHKESTAAHTAEHIAYTGPVVGVSNMKAAVDSVKQQLDTAVTAGDSSVAASLASIDVEGVEHPSLKARIDSDVVKLNEQLAETAEELATKAAQTQVNTLAVTKAERSALDQTNSDVSATNQRIDTLIIGSGNANAEVSEAHVSTVKNKTYTTVRNRLEDSESDFSQLNLALNTVLVNNVVNGNFAADMDSDGLADNWERSDSGVTVSYDSGEHAQVLNPQYPNTWVGQYTPSNFVNGRIYAIVLDLKKTVSTYTEFRVGLGLSSAFLIENSALINSVDYNTATYTRIIKRIVYTEAANAKNLVLMSGNGQPSHAKVKNFMLIDLTAAYGYGNEPSVEELTDVIDDEGWFDNYVGLPKYALKTEVVEPGLPATNLVINGDFASGATGYTAASAAYTVDSGRGRIVNTAQWGQISQNISTVAGHKYYFALQMEGTKDNFIQFGSAAAYMPFAGKYRFSGIITATASVHALQMADKTASGWQPYYVDNIIVIDLTAMYGAGNEPASAKEIDYLLASLPGMWFGGDERFAPEVIAEARAKYQAVSKSVITVDAAGSGDFTSIQSAIDSLATTFTGPYDVVTIRIKDGTYNEVSINLLKHYVYLQGESRDGVIIRGDGLTVPGVGIPEKHGIDCRVNTVISNVTFDSNDVKYCVHNDNASIDGFAYTARFVNCRFIHRGSADNLYGYPVGIGSWADQKNIFEDCEFVKASNSANTSWYGVLWHNWNNQPGPTELHLTNCTFKNCAVVTASDLGSDNNDLIKIDNCRTNLKQKGIYLDANKDFYTSGGVLVNDFALIPYCIRFEVAGPIPHYDVYTDHRPDTTKYHFEGAYDTYIDSSLSIPRGTGVAYNYSAMFSTNAVSAASGAIDGVIGTDGFMIPRGKTAYVRCAADAYVQGDMLACVGGVFAKTTDEAQSVAIAFQAVTLGSAGLLTAYLLP